MSKIICVGRNYVEHIHELNNEIPSEPVYFIKPISCMSDEIKVVNYSPMHYEGEICFLIYNKKPIGVGFGFDMTLREIQIKLKKRELPWERAKAFKNSAVFSEFVPFSGFDGLEVEVVKNGEIVQRGGVDLMIYKPEFLIEDIDKIFGLEDGDIIMSGTPKGVGVVNKGDEFIGRIYKNGEKIIERRFFVS